LREVVEAGEVVFRAAVGEPEGALLESREDGKQGQDGRFTSAVLLIGSLPINAPGSGNPKTRVLGDRLEAAPSR
jgi:hypothetical protein